MNDSLKCCFKTIPSVAFHHYNFQFKSLDPMAFNTHKSVFTWTVLDFLKITLAAGKTCVISLHSVNNLQVLPPCLLSFVSL